MLAARLVGKDGRLVAFGSYGTASPITEAGVVFGDPKRQRGLGEVLLKVLSNERYHASHAAGGRGAQESFFSWEAIAERYAEVRRSAD
ncbi:MAG: hypothetical protein WA639_18310 [Candidatus Acidiferrum sp.]